MTSARWGLGLAALGRPAYITTDRDRDLGNAAGRSVEALRDRAHAMLEAAWEGGVRYVDAARSYGLAEQFLGSWLALHPDRRAELTIGSKWGYEYVGNWRMDADVHERKEHSLDLFDRQWGETLDALGTTPDVYLVHSVTPGSPALDEGPLLERLRERAAETRIGLSTSGPDQGAVIDAALALVDTPFSAVQTTWNLLEPSAGPALARAHDRGWLVVVKEVLANGRLATESFEGLPQDPASAAALAMGIALAQPWADIVLTGAVTPAQLDAALSAAADAQPTLPAATAVAIAIAENPTAYWDARARRDWS